MTIEECYKTLHGSYTEAKSRLMSDKLITKFILKFPADPTMETLRSAVASGNREEAFRAAHTLKGVAANLAFTELFQSASFLTEQLRSLNSDPDSALVDAVEQQYALVITTLKEFAKE